MQTGISREGVNPRVLALVDRIKSRDLQEVREDRSKHSAKYEQADRLLRLVREKGITAVFFPGEYLNEFCDHLEKLTFEKPSKPNTSTLIPYLSTAAKRDIQALYDRIHARNPAEVKEDRTMHPEKYEQADRYRRLTENGIAAFGMHEKGTTNLKELVDFVENRRY